MRVSFTQLLAAAGEALPTNPWKAVPAWRLPHSQWLSLLCTAIMANGLMISASELSPATRDDPEVFFFTDPDVSLISGPNHWSTRAARTWFGNEAIEEKAASIPDEWQQQESFPHGVVPHRLLRDAIIDHRLEKCAEEFPCSDLFSPSSVRYGSDPMDKLSSRGSPHDWMAEAPIAESPLTTAEEISSEHMIFTLVQKYLEWEMREILQKRSARQWSECFDLLPQVCHAPAPSVKGSPTMHGLWRMTSRSCVLPVSTQWLSDDSGATDLASHHHQDPFLELGHHDGLQSSADKNFSCSTSLILLIVLILLFLGFLRHQHGRAHQG